MFARGLALAAVPPLFVIQPHRVGIICFGQRVRDEQVVVTAKLCGSEQITDERTGITRQIDPRDAPRGETIPHRVERRWLHLENPERRAFNLVQFESALRFYTGGSE